MIILPIKLKETKRPIWKYIVHIHTIHIGMGSKHCGHVAYQIKGNETSNMEIFCLYTHHPHWDGVKRSKHCDHVAYQIKGNETSNMEIFSHTHTAIHIGMGSKGQNIVVMSPIKLKETKRPPWKCFAYTHTMHIGMGSKGQNIVVMLPIKLK